MPSKLVGVDSGLHLPTAVRNQLSADLTADMSAFVDDAEAAAGNAALSATAADTSADIAVAAAASASAPTDGMVASLINTPGSDTRDALDDYGVDALVPATIAALGDDVVKRIDDRASVLSWTALPVNGSTKTASGFNTGTRSVQINPAGAYEAFPGLTLCPDGSLLATYRSASAHGWAPGSATKAVRSTDLGQTWSAPWTIYTDPGEDIGFGMLTTLSDGRIACIGQYRSAAPATGALCIIIFSSDNGTTWSAPITIPFTFTDFSYAAGNVIELTNGNLLAIGYGKNTADTYTSTRTMISTDGGVTWGTERTVANGTTDSKPYNEAVIGYMPNGQILALIRSEESPTKNIYKSISTDGGLTWSAPATLFPGWGRPAWTSMASGGIVMTYRGNSDLSHQYRVSYDNGVTWSGARQMAGQTPTQSVYTQLVELAPGLIAVAYSDDSSTTVANTRFKYLMDGVGLSPLGDLSGDSYYAASGITAGSGWSLAAASGYSGLAWRAKNGYANINGIASKASFAANELIATMPQEIWPDRIIWQGNYRIGTTGEVRVVSAGTVNTVVYLHYPLP